LAITRRSSATLALSEHQADRLRHDDSRERTFLPDAPGNAISTPPYKYLRVFVPLLRAEVLIMF
jgi:hypothetical protein